MINKCFRTLTNSLLIACFVTLPALGENKPVWFNLQSGMKKAQETHKYVVADLYTDWCSWCKVLDRDTFHNPNVESFLSQNVICVRVNAEDGGSGQNLAMKYRVAGYPTVLVLAPNGRLVGQHVGFLAAEDFIKAITADLKKAERNR